MSGSTENEITATLAFEQPTAPVGTATAAAMPASAAAAPSIPFLSWPNPTPINNSNNNAQHQPQEDPQQAPFAAAAAKPEAATTQQQQPGPGTAAALTQQQQLQYQQMMMANQAALTQQQQQQAGTAAAHPHPAQAVFAAFMQSQQQQPPSQSTAAAAAVAPTQRPTYVNAKQFHRILRRRETRAVLQEHYRKQIEARKKHDPSKPYQHESRHRHAMKRPRVRTAGFSARTSCRPTTPSTPTRTRPIPRIWRECSSGKPKKPRLRITSDKRPPRRPAKQQESSMHHHAKSLIHTHKLLKDHSEYPERGT